MRIRRATRYRLNRKALLEIARDRGWVKADGTLYQRRFAAAIGISESMVSHFLADEDSKQWKPVTDGFIGRVVAAGIPFDEVFEPVRKSRRRVA